MLILEPVKIWLLGRSLHLLNARSSTVSDSKEIGINKFWRVPQILNNLEKFVVFEFGNNILKKKLLILFWIMLVLYSINAATQLQSLVFEQPRSSRYKNIWLFAIGGKAGLVNIKPDSFVNRKYFAFYNNKINCYNCNILKLLKCTGYPKND